MSINPFVWLRAAARNAVLGGVEDALAETMPTLETLAIGTRLSMPMLPDATQADEPIKAKAVRK